VDYYRVPKLGYTTLQTSMQPILPSIEYQINDPQAPLTLWVVNDTYRDLKGSQVCWTIGTAERKCQAAEIGPDSVAKITTLGALPQVTAGDQKLNVSIEQGGQTLGKNSLGADDFIVRQPRQTTAEK
jgi:hypothetical protein